MRWASTLTQRIAMMRAAPVSIGSFDPRRLIHDRGQPRLHYGAPGHQSPRAILLCRCQEVSQARRRLHQHPCEPAAEESGRGCARAKLGDSPTGRDTLMTFTKTILAIIWLGVIITFCLLWMNP